MSDGSVVNEPIKPDKVKGSDCLDWIDKPIGFASKRGKPQTIWEDYQSTGYNYFSGNLKADVVEAGNDRVVGYFTDSVALSRFNHDTSKRIVGYVTDEYDDGGIRVIILGNELIDQSPGASEQDRNVKWYGQELTAGISQTYKTNPLSTTGEMIKDGEVPAYPEVVRSWSMPTTNAFRTRLGEYSYNTVTTDGATIDQMIDWDPPLAEYNRVTPMDALTDQNGHRVTSMMLTNNKNTSMVFGTGVKNISMPYSSILYWNPLILLSGDLYTSVITIMMSYKAACPRRFDNRTAFLAYNQHVATTTLNSFNLSAIPYNIILTKDYSQAKNYLSNGTLPSDAWLYPLDWTKLPKYDIEPDDTPDDETDDGDDPDNNPGFDGDPDLPSAPSFTPSTMSRNNYYWIGIGTLDAFINWFWYDVGRWNDFEDIINTIEGLYNNLGSAVLNIRYMPVSNNAYELGGLSTAQNIKVGMIEKSGAVDTLPGGEAPLVDIGHVTVPKKYSSFASYSPYSECMLYLPLHGFINIDMDMFTGHDLYVKASYDMLTGTVQYFIYYENKFLVNTLQAKMAVDIPITLQSKNDRDSAIFSNVSSAVAGLMGGAISAGTGNPLGLVVGANAMNSGVASAPMAVKGTVGESGAFYGPSKCKLITKFPVQQKPSSFDQIVGKQLNKTMKLSNSKLSGFTQCYQPRITFSKKVPLRSEIEEIYKLLEEGVII